MLRLGHTSAGQYSRKSSVTSGSIAFALSPSIRRPFVLSFVEGNGLLLSTVSGRRVNSRFNSL
jgi:hypothetical protein